MNRLMAAGDVTADTGCRKSPRQIGLKLRICDDRQIGLVANTKRGQPFDVTMRNQHAGAKAIRFRAYRFERAAADRTGCS